MTRDFIVYGSIIFFHARAASDQDGISCGRLCFRETELETAINTGVNIFTKQDPYQIEEPRSKLQGMFWHAAALRIDRKEFVYFRLAR